MSDMTMEEMMQLDGLDFDPALLNFSHFFNITGEEELGTLEYLYVLPVIITIGVVGNAVSLITIFLSRLRTVPANQYLIVMTTADTVFLLGVAMIMFKVDYLSFVSCVLVEYVLMCSSYISAWATAALTIERYIALVHPLLAVRLSSKSRVRWFLCWVPIPLVLHLLQFHILVPTSQQAIAAGMETTAAAAAAQLDRGCTISDDGYQFWVELGDSLMSYVIPCVVVVMLNALVAYHMAMSRSYFNGGDSRAITRADSKRSGGHLTILWVVPMVFVLLNSPFYIVKMVELFERTTSTEIQTYSHFRMVLHNLAHYLYYLNFSCDVIVYAFSSSHFRKAVYTTFRKIMRAQPKKKPRYTAMEMSKVHHNKTENSLLNNSLVRKPGSDIIRVAQTDIVEDVSSAAQASSV